MARTSFRLPNVEELSIPQQDALDLPLAGQHLIVGGPGTGKSVVALMRAARLARKGKNYLFLVYNVLLEKSCYALGGAELRAIRWKTWFKDNFKNWFGRVMPAKNSDGDEQDEDWASIDKLEPLPDVDTSLYLVIDEGQDMPPEFYRTLMKIGLVNFYVVADQNQRITQQNSSIKEIRQALGVQKPCELKQNYRNSFPIARLAKEFFTNDPASPPIELPKPVPGGTIPRMVRYGGDLEADIQRVALHILRSYDRDVDKLICIITPNDAVRKKFCQILRDLAQAQSFDHDAPDIQTYFYNQRITAADGQDKSEAMKCPLCGARMLLRKNRADESSFWGCSNYPKGCKHTKVYVPINFKEGGIAVINQQSVKGLEFDIVYIADIDRFYAKNKDELMKIFYVMTSRASDELFLLRTGNISPRVDEIIPHDETILKKG